MHINQFAGLFELKSVDQLSTAVFRWAESYGFEKCIFRVVPNKFSAMDKGFVLTNYDHQWCSMYSVYRYCDIDPIVRHCYSTHFPMLWDKSNYSSPSQAIMYKHAESFGLNSGVAFPIHGANGEFGMMNFATNTPISKIKKEHISNSIPILSIFKDYVFESSKSFNNNLPYHSTQLTPREKEVINWCAAGKTSWEVSRILSCSESTINFHLSNIRNKFNVGSTQLAVVKALRSGLIHI
jgi:LuxR family transcriptional regulator, quorum-sensing system regulator LasR